MPNILRYPVPAWKRVCASIEYQSSVVLTSLSLGFLRNITAEDLQQASDLVRSAAERVHVRLDEVKNIRTGAYEYYWVSAMTTNKTRAVSPATIEYAYLQQSVFIAQVLESTLNGVRILDLMGGSHAVWDAFGQKAMNITTDSTLNFVNNGSCSDIRAKYENFLNGSKSPRVLLDNNFINTYCKPLLDAVANVQGLAQGATYSSPVTLVLLEMAENLQNVQGYLFGWKSRGSIANTSNFKLPARLEPTNFVNTVMRLAEADAKQETTKKIITQLGEVDVSSFLNTDAGLQLSDKVTIDVWDKVTSIVLDAYISEAHYLHSLKLAISHFDDWAIAALMKAVSDREPTLPDFLSFAVSMLSTLKGLARTKAKDDIDTEYRVLHEKYGTTIVDVILPIIKRWYKQLDAADVFNFAIRKIQDDGRTLINFVSGYSWSDHQYKLCAYTCDKQNAVLTMKRADLTPSMGNNLPPAQVEWTIPVKAPAPTNKGVTTSGLVYNIPNLQQIRLDLAALARYIECSYDPELNTLVVNEKSYIGTITPPQYGPDVVSTGSSAANRRSSGMSQYQITPIDPASADVDALLFAVTSPMALAASEEQRKKMYAERVERLGQSVFIEKQIEYGPIGFVDLFSPATFAVLSKIYCNPDAVTSRRRFFILPSGVTTSGMSKDQLFRSVVLPRKVTLQFYLPAYALTESGVQLLAQQNKIVGPLSPRLQDPVYELEYSQTSSDEPWGYNILADPIAAKEQRVRITLRISVDDDVDCFGQQKVPIATPKLPALSGCFAELSSKRLLVRQTYSQPNIALAFNEKHDVVSVFDENGPIAPSDLFRRGFVFGNSVASTLLMNLAALVRDAYIILANSGGARQNFYANFCDIAILKSELAEFKKQFEDKVCEMSVPMTLQQLDSSFGHVGLPELAGRLSDLNTALNPLTGDLSAIADTAVKPLADALMGVYNAISAFNGLRLSTLNVSVATPINGQRVLMAELGKFAPRFFEAPKVVSSVTLPSVPYVDSSFMTYMANTVKEILNTNFTR